MNKENSVIKKGKITKQRTNNKQDLKQVQQELTQNLVKTYSAIRPTIIQAQRILKVFEGLEENMRWLKLITHDRLMTEDHQTPGCELARLKLILKSQSETFQTLKGERDNLITDKNTLEEIQDLETESDNIEIQELSQQIDAKTGQITELKYAFGKNVRLFVRAAKKAGKWSEVEGSELMEDVHGFLVSLKFLFLKKLSTGFDEEEFHRRQISGLKELIATKESRVEQEEAELRLLKEKRGKDNLRKKNEIDRLVKELAQVQQDRKDSLLKMQTESARIKKTNESNHAKRVEFFFLFENIKI